LTDRFMLRIREPEAAAAASNTAEPDPNAGR
jgi:hypothetical protein